MIFSIRKTVRGNLYAVCEVLLGPRSNNTTFELGLQIRES